MTYYIIERNLWGDVDREVTTTEAGRNQIVSDMLSDMAERMNRALVQDHGAPGPVIDFHIADDWETTLRQMQCAWLVQVKPKDLFAARPDVPADVTTATLSDYLTDAELDRYAECSLSVYETAVAPPDFAKALRLYHKLHDGLSDMIEGGRLTEADIPDDYAWLVESLASVANVGPREVQPEGPPPPTWVKATQDALAAMEKLLYIHHNPDDDEDTEDDYEANTADEFRAIWAEVEAIANAAPPLGQTTLYVGAIDSDNGGTMAVTGWSETDVSRAAIEAGGGDWGEYQEWLARHAGPDGEYKPDSQWGGDPVCDFMKRSDDLFSWTYDTVEVPAYAAAPAPEIAVIVDDGLVQDVIQRPGAPVRVHIVDFDIEGCDEDRLSKIVMDGDDTEAVLSTYDIDTFDDEAAFWASLNWKGERNPVLRTVYVSVVMRNGWEDRISVFTTEQARLEDLANYFDEMVPGVAGIRSGSETLDELKVLISEHLNETVVTDDYAMAEGG